MKFWKENWQNAVTDVEKNTNFLYKSQTFNQYQSANNWWYQKQNVGKKVGSFFSIQNLP